MASIIEPRVFEALTLITCMFVCCCYFSRHPILYRFQYSFCLLSTALYSTLLWSHLSVSFLFVFVFKFWMASETPEGKCIYQFVAWLEWLIINHHCWQLLLWYSLQGLTKRTCSRSVKQHSNLGVKEKKEADKKIKIKIKSYFLVKDECSPRL